MTATLIIEQILNGLQFGVMLFLMAAGLTLVFGVMGLINLAHANGVRVEYAVTSTDVSANNALLTSKTYYTRAADALVAKVVADGADGINIEVHNEPERAQVLSDLGDWLVERS